MTDDWREKMIKNADDHGYRRYTGPQELDKALHTLEGLLKGIAVDGKIGKKEVTGVRQWMREHSKYANRHPFNDIIPFLDDVLADGVVDQEEARDVLWVCERLSTPNEYFAAITSDIQRLQGMLAGVAADGNITEQELRGLGDWMDEHEDLKGCWPFDELEAVILDVLRDGRVDSTEHQLLLALFAEFTESGKHYAVNSTLNALAKPVSGICAACPEVTFKDRIFCFTGRSMRATRRKLATLVEELGGIFIPSVRTDLNYLVIGAAGNEAWAFACYGRKVEQAMNCRKEGQPVVLVHENDFWDAVADAGR